MESCFFSLAGQRDLIDDAAVLLNHLTVLPDAKLDASFASAGPSSVGGSPDRPPASTTSKDEFLARLMGIGERIAKASGQGGASGPLSSDDVAFLISARDFLANLSKPTTVDSIRITREYVRYSLISALARALRRGWSRVFRRPLPPSEDGPLDSRSARFGRGLALRVGIWNLTALVLVVSTVMLSIYALKGRGLLQELSLSHQQFNALSADMEAAEVKDQPIFATLSGIGEQNGSTPARLIVQRYCDAVETGRQYADGTTKALFISRQQQKLCDRYDGYSLAVLRLYGQIKCWLAEPVRASFSVLVGSLANNDQCNHQGGNRLDPAQPGEGKPADGAYVDWNLQQIQSYHLYEVTAQVALQAITNYLLPCLYAALGALAAAFGNLARKAEDATLSFSDGTVVSRTLVLGVLFGAVIGLFTSQVKVAGSSSVASLTPGALSLLAGYSVAQVFQFFDGLSLRVFGPRPPAGTPTT